MRPSDSRFRSCMHICASQQLRQSGNRTSEVGSTGRLNRSPPLYCDGTRRTLTWDSADLLNNRKETQVFFPGNRPFGQWNKQAKPLFCNPSIGNLGRKHTITSARNERNDDRYENLRNRYPPDMSLIRVAARERIIFK